MINTWLKYESKFQNNSKVTAITRNYTDEGWWVDVKNGKVKSRLKFLFFIQITTNPNVQYTKC